MPDDDMPEERLRRVMQPIVTSISKPDFLQALSENSKHEVYAHATSIPDDELAALNVSGLNLRLWNADEDWVESAVSRMPGEPELLVLCYFRVPAGYELLDMGSTDWKSLSTEATLPALLQYVHTLL